MIFVPADEDAAIFSRSHPRAKMIKAHRATAARRSLPFGIGPEGTCISTTTTTRMASKAIVHLLIACGVLAATTCE